MNTSSAKLSASVISNEDITLLALSPDCIYRNDKAV